MLHLGLFSKFVMELVEKKYFYLAFDRLYTAVVTTLEGLTPE
jgi:hypothetical protein